jgi:hypothetical protein
MAKREYPRIGTCAKKKAWAALPEGKGPKCQAAGCTSTAHYRVDVEVNWFRGDDESRRACEAHKDDPYALLQLPKDGDAAA